MEIEHKLHLARAQEFTSKKRRLKLLASSSTDITVISFDFMQNLPLPNMVTNAVFYSRQLWYYVFGIHDLARNNVFMYSYYEGVAKRWQNDVTSMLLHWLNKHLPQGKKNLYILSDGCSGQNKNFVMIWFWYMVVHVLKKIDCVIHIFPIRGHSFLPNDADFHLFSNARKTILADIPEDWDKVVLEVRKTPKPFILEKAKQEDFFNIKDMLKPYFRANYGKNFKLRQVRMYKIDRDNVGEVIAKQNSFFGSWERFKILKKTVYLQQFPINYPIMV